MYRRALICAGPGSDLFVWAGGEAFVLVEPGLSAKFVDPLRAGELEYLFIDILINLKL